MSEEIGRISIASLKTEEGVTKAGAAIATAMLECSLYPILDHVPADRKRDLFERFLCGIAGAMCSQFGPDAARAVLDAVKLAIDDAQASRRKAQH